MSTVENRGPLDSWGNPRSSLHGRDPIVIDLGAVEMVDSSTLRLLRRIAGRLPRADGRLSVICPHPGRADLLHLTLLSESFPVFGSRDAALRPAR